MPAPLNTYVITPHAARQIAWRGLTESMIGAVLRRPEQRLLQFPGREVFQSRRRIAGKLYLIRVFVDTWCETPEVVTAYHTRRIAKYWRHDESAL